MKELFETQEKIAGPLRMTATGELVKVGDVLGQGYPEAWREATVLAIEEFDAGEGPVPVYVVQWKVIGEVPDDVLPHLRVKP